MTHNQKEVILKVNNLKQYFKIGSGRSKSWVKAVDDISFEVYKGEVFSLVGESGCGKTTTGRSIIKLYETTGGEVFFHDTRIISDVNKAKADYKVTVTNAKALLDAETATLKEKLEKNLVTKEEFDKESALLTSDYNHTVAQANAILKEAKKDKNFERHISKEGKEAVNNLESLPEYADILNKYALRNAELKVLIENSLTDVEKTKGLNDKALLQEKLEVSKNYQKELRLNELRQSQDIANLKYSLIKKNRLLMRRMQMIFQDPIASLNPRMTVKEIIAEGLRINGVKNEKEIEERVNDALKTVGLVPEHAGRYPHEFSGGQRQRIGIARALVVNPSFIIADEPISALDVSIRAQVINLLNDLREKQGITILFIAHDLSVVKYFSDRLAVMYFGKIVEMGDKDKIFNNPLHPYTLSLLDAIPLPDPAYEKSRGALKRYNPSASHDYSKEQPTLREVEPNHFILCNSEEFARYQAQIKK